MSVCVESGNRRQLIDYSGKSVLAVKGFASGFRTKTVKPRKKLNYAKYDEKFLYVEMTRVRIWISSINAYDDYQEPP
jgi:hypothetical protein